MHAVTSGTSVTFIYILCLCEAKDSQRPLPQRGQLLDNTPRVYKNVQMGPFSSQGVWC